MVTLCSSSSPFLPLLLLLPLSLSLPPHLYLSLSFPLPPPTCCLLTQGQFTAWLSQDGQTVAWVEASAPDLASEAPDGYIYFMPLVRKIGQAGPDSNGGKQSLPYNGQWPASTGGRRQWQPPWRPAIFVSLGCCDKWPPNGGLKTTDVYSLTAQEARSVKPRCRPVSGRAGSVPPGALREALAQAALPVSRGCLQPFAFLDL